MPDQISKVLNYGSEPGTNEGGLAQGLGGLADVAEILASSFAKNPQKRAYFQSRVQNKEAAKRQQLQQDASMSLDRLKLYGQLFATAGGMEKIPSVVQAFQTEVANANKIGQKMGRGNLGDQAAGLVSAMAQVRPQGEPFTLSPGQVRFDPSGQPTAAVPGEPQLSPFERDLRTLQGYGVELTPEQMMQRVVGAPRATTTVEVPGEFGTTRVTTGGAAPTAMPAGGGAPGQEGKPLPREAQDSLTGAFSTLGALQTIRNNIGKAAGPLAGRARELEADWIGTDEGAVEFQTAVKNLKSVAQSIIKGIPSNFDVQTFIATLPALTDPPSVAQNKLNFTTKLTEQLIRDTVGYYKYTGFRVPPGVLKQAQTFGIDLDAVPSWGGGGNVTATSELLLDAQSSIAKGAPREAVIQRLRALGVDPAGL